MEHRYFNVTVVFVSYTSRILKLVRHLLIQNEYTETVSYFKNIKTCVSELCLLSQGHTDHMLGPFPLSKHHSDSFLGTIELYSI